MKTSGNWWSLSGSNR